MRLPKKRYSEALALYQGELESLRSRVDPNIKDNVKLFEKACEDYYMMCFPVNSISPGKQIEQNRYEFAVELLGKDGQIVKIWPAGEKDKITSKFNFVVAKNSKGFVITSQSPWLSWLIWAGQSICPAPCLCKSHPS